MASEQVATPIRLKVARLMRYGRRLPLALVLGKVRQILVYRTVVWFVYKRSARSNHALVSNTAELRPFAHVFADQGARLDGNTSEALMRGLFVSGAASYDFGSVSAIRPDIILKSSPMDVRLEHDLSFFTFSMPVTSTNPEAIAVVAEIVKNFERALEKDRDLGSFAWSPIAISFRLMSLCSVLALHDESDGDGSPEAEQTLRRHIEICGRVLELVVERYLGYNHAVFTECGLLAYRLLKGDRRGARCCAVRALKTLTWCTLPDGTWSERSPAYHLHMLLMLRAIKSTGLLLEVGREAAEDLETRMMSALDVLVHPDGDIAVYNDAAIMDAPSPALFGWPSGPTRPKTLLLADAGYVRVEAGFFSAILDAGPMGPDDVVGHGHADFLSIELLFSSKRLIVDPGVASISSDDARVWTRSAFSHNGPTFGGLEPVEFFGAWRVGRSGTAWVEDLQLDSGGRTVSVKGSCDGWRPMGGEVSRTLTADVDTITIEDEWYGAPELTRRTSLLIPADWDLERGQLGKTFELVHEHGLRVLCTVEGAHETNIGADVYYPSGPATATRAHRLSFDCPNSRLKFHFQAAG